MVSLRLSPTLSSEQMTSYQCGGEEEEEEVEKVIAHIASPRDVTGSRGARRGRRLLRQRLPNVDQRADRDLLVGIAAVGHEVPPLEDPAVEEL